MQHIIIGAGPAGIVAAETLRKADPDAIITIIGDEAEPPYSRMAIPYYLTDQINESGSYLRDPGAYYQRLNIGLIQQKVNHLDTMAKQVILADGSHHYYDKLLLATGSHPVSPPIPGLDLAQVRELAEEAAQGEVCQAANDNDPAQVVVSGNKAAVERAAELAKERGAKRALMLPVSAPFHCRLVT